MVVSGLDINWGEKKSLTSNKKKQVVGKIMPVINFFQYLGKVVQVLGLNQEPHPVPDKGALPQPHPQPVQMGSEFYFHFFLHETPAT